MILSKEDRDRLRVLTKACKESQGEYLLWHHGPGSWATRYSFAFVNSATEIYQIFKNAGCKNPLMEMSFHFIDSDISSCRGTMMTLDRVKYLYETYIKQRIEQANDH